MPPPGETLTGELSLRGTASGLIPVCFFGEDTLFNVEYLLRAEHCTYIPKLVYEYTICPESASRRFQLEPPRNLAKQVERIRAALEQSGMFLPLEREYFSYAADNLNYALVWSVYSPLNPASYREKHRLCLEMRKNPIYRQAMQYLATGGDLSLRNMSRQMFSFFLAAMRLDYGTLMQTLLSLSLMEKPPVNGVQLLP